MTCGFSHPGLGHLGMGGVDVIVSPPDWYSTTPIKSHYRKTVRRRGQRTIVTVFRDLLLQSLDLFTQLGDDFLQHRDLLDLFQQQAILLSSLNQFIFHCHALTLLDTTGFGKSLGDLTSY